MKGIIFRYPKNTVTDILICLFCIFLICLIMMNPGNDSALAVAENERIDFLSSYGWSVDLSSEEFSKIKLPELSDEAFREYIDLQKSQGFDISQFAGKYVDKYTYEVQNFPGYENSDGIFATVFIYDKKIIAADIYSSATDGFIQGVIT